MAEQFRVARNICAVGPSQVSIIAFFAEESRMSDGRQEWDTMPARGLNWGDMDQFH